MHAAGFDPGKNYPVICAGFLTNLLTTQETMKQETKNFSQMKKSTYEYKKNYRCINNILFILWPKYKQILKRTPTNIVMY